MAKKVQCNLGHCIECVNQFDNGEGLPPIPCGYFPELDWRDYGKEYEDNIYRMAADPNCQSVEFTD